MSRFLRIRRTRRQLGGLIDGSDPNGLNGSAGELRRIVADIGDGKVMTLTGPFSFDEQGFLSGKFKLEIERLGPWGDSLKQTFPDIASTVYTATKLLKSLAGGKDTAENIPGGGARFIIELPVSESRIAA